jgi:hypothetical protein
MPQAVRHVKAKLDLDISEDTARRLGLPPVANRTNAFRYKGHVAFKMGSKRNDRRDDKSGNAQFASSDVRVTSEMFAMHADDTVMLCTDTMNKLKVGAMAVSRFHQIQHFFLQGQNPN